MLRSPRAPIFPGTTRCKLTKRHTTMSVTARGSLRCWGSCTSAGSGRRPQRSRGAAVRQRHCAGLPASTRCSPALCQKIHPKDGTSRGCGEPWTRPRVGKEVRVHQSACTPPNPSVTCRYQGTVVHNDTLSLLQLRPGQPNPRNLSQTCVCKIIKK